MSMRVMQAKYNSRIKRQQMNSQTALSYGNQQGYGLYLRRATMGIGAVASRVVGDSYTHPVRGERQATLTYKRPQEFTTSNYINNKKAKALRCEYSNKDSTDACKTVADPKCHDNCGKNGKYTQDLGYLSAEQQINKKLALRAGHTHSAKLESDLMNSGGCTS